MRWTGLLVDLRSPIPSRHCALGGLTMEQRVIRDIAVSSAQFTGVEQAIGWLRIQHQLCSTCNMGRCAWPLHRNFGGSGCRRLSRNPFGSSSDTWAKRLMPRLILHVTFKILSALGPIGARHLLLRQTRRRCITYPLPTSPCRKETPLPQLCAVVRALC